MTPEDIAQITAIVAAAEQRTTANVTSVVAAAEQRTTANVTSAVAAAEQRINANVTSAVAAAEQRINANVAAAEQRMIGRMERTMEALTANLSEVRKELITRLDTLDRRTDRTEINVNAILMQLSGISRSLTVGEQLSSQFAATQGAQQHAIDQLAQRISKIERELHPDQQ
jgi:hypothetical protein